MQSMDLNGLPNKIFNAVTDIYYGRIGLTTNGAEREGRISYEIGITDAFSVFQEAEVSGDLNIFILAELTFLQQEFQFCNDADTFAQSSLTHAIQSLEDALLSLEAVSDPSYKIADKIFPHSPKYRIDNCPKDAFHLACIAHRTRLLNILRSPGINMIEKDVLKQRIANMNTAQKEYIKKQKKILGI